jgi:MFS family permease
MPFLGATVGPWLFPPEAHGSARPVLVARGLRALADGCMAVLLPAYLLALGLGTIEVGVIATATLLGSALTTIAVGAFGHRYSTQRLLKAAALLMAATGVFFAGFDSFWPLLVVAFFGTLNPSSGDVSVFLPLEHARLAHSASGHARTTLFARYSLAGAICAALGALGAALPELAHNHFGIPRLESLRAMFIAYSGIGLLVWCLYRNAPPERSGQDVRPAVALGASRRTVTKLALLFSVDAFAGGLVVNALMSLWLMQRVDLSLAQIGLFFFWTGLLSAGSQIAAPWLARRIGLLNTMVFTHIPANICLVGAALVPSLPLAIVLLTIRSALSQMDVPTRSAYVMAVVTPPERPAAASFTAVPRSLASALSPSLAGALFAAGWLSLPLIACGVLKLAYDLTLWRACRKDPLLDS